MWAFDAEVHAAEAGFESSWVGRGDGGLVLRQVEGMEMSGEAVKEQLGRCGATAVPGGGTGGAAVEGVAHDGDAGKGGVGTRLMRAQVTRTRFPKTPIPSCSEAGKAGGAFFALGGGGNHLGLSVVWQERGIDTAGFGAAILVGEEMNGGFDRAVAVLFAQNGDGGTVQAEEGDATACGVEVVNGTETGSAQPEQFGFLVLKLDVEGGIEIGVSEVPGVLTHGNSGRFRKSDPIGGKGKDGQAQGFRPEQRRREADGGRCGGIFGRRGQGLFRATKKPRFGKRIRGQ